MARYRTFNVAFKRQVAQEFLTGESLNSLSRKYDGLEARRRGVRTGVRAR